VEKAPSGEKSLSESSDAVLGDPSASSWPCGTVQLYVPAAAGDGSDMIARVFAQAMSEETGGNFVVVNDATGGGSVAACPVISSVAVKMGPWEYFALGLLAITLVVSLSRGKMLKGFIGAAIGLLSTQIGYAPISSTPRFTFGSYYLSGGFNMVCVLTGLFAGCMIMHDYAKGETGISGTFQGNIGRFHFPLKDMKDNVVNGVRSFLIGLGIGFLPGMGAALSNVVAYSVAKNSSKHPEEFGKGCVDGIIAPEVANNASVGGAIIPMLLKAPYHYLYPAILVLSLIGVYTNSGNIFSVFMAMAFTALGLWMGYAGIPATPFILSYVLGGTLETNFRKAISFARGDVFMFFKRPVSCILLLIVVFSVLRPYIQPLFQKKEVFKRGKDDSRK